MGGNKWFIHSPGSRLGFGGSFAPDSALTGSGFLEAMIFALRGRGGCVGLNPNGSSAATD
jgi:hypothetical protein